MGGGAGVGPEKRAGPERPGPQGREREAMNGAAPDDKDEVVKQPLNERSGPGGRWGAAGMPLERSKDFKNSSRRLATRLRPEGLGVTGVLVLAVSSVVLYVIGPRILGEATNVIVEGVFTGSGIDYGELHRILLIALVVYIAS